MWLPEEIDILKRYYGNIDINDIPLNKSIHAIRHKVGRLGLYKDQSLLSRFFSKVTKTDTCWLWKIRGRRYGYIRVDGLTRRVNRVSWEIHFGSIPDNLEVCHTCDNTFCVNPDHLFLGTHSDNMTDMKIKNRANGGCPSGVLNGASKLTEKQVLEIRKLGLDNLSHQTIADLFNISRRNVSFILSRKTWEHI